MPSITYAAASFELLPGETVLRCLKRHGAIIPSSCEAGACQSCLMRLTDGILPAGAQQGLKDTLCQQGYFLACLARPDRDLGVALPDAHTTRFPVLITESDDLSPDVRRVRMRVEGAFACRGGQFISLIRDDDLVRPYSVASLPDRDGFLELHVRRTPDGRMSNWIHDQLQPGHRLHIRGPAGDCFYLPGEPDAPLLLVGTGTGLAPLYAVIQDALRHQHRGPLVLLHGALHEDGFYLVEELSRLAAQHPNLTYRRCLPEGTPAPGVDIGPLEALTRTHVPKPAAWRAYLCGNPTLVHSVRKQLFLAGAGMKRIHSDAFISAAPPAAPASG